MKILVVNTGLLPSPPLKGGAIELHTYNLVKWLSAFGHEVHYLSDFTREAEFSNNVILHNIGYSRSSFHQDYSKYVVNTLVGGYLTYRAAQRTIAGERFDIVHFHEKVSGYLFGRKFGASFPIVYTCHNPISNLNTNEFALKRYVRDMGFEFLELNSIRKARTVVTVSAQLRDELIKRKIAPEKIFHVPNGVDTSFFTPHKIDRKVKEFLNLPDQYVLFTGRLEKRKGVAYLLKAMKDVSSCLVVAGNGPEKQSLERLSKSLNLEEKVTFLNLVSNEELREIYSGAMFFVLPSLAEGLPLVLLEAMASGLPVISSSNSAGEVIVDWETGFTVPVGNVSMLASRINLLLDDEVLRAKMSRRARQVAEREYDWQHVTSKIVQVYKRTMNCS